MTDDLAPFRRYAERLADVGRAIALPAWSSAAGFSIKDDGSPVTITDREIETRWRTMIRADWPGHGIHGEEFGTERPDAEWIWALDPIDGTKNFVCGHRTWGHLIALVRRGRPVVGVIDAPAIDERWVAVAGGVPEHTGATRRPIGTRDVATLSGAVLSMTTSVDGRAVAGPLAQAVGLHQTGGDCVSYALLASGRIDLVVEDRLGADDWMALVPVVEGAGGSISDWRGRPLGWDGDGTVLASANAVLHRAALERLAS